MSSSPLRLLILGAHPDDAEYHAGGLASIYRELGHVVRMVSVTDGSAGHHRITGPALTAIRRQEAAASGAVIGAEYVVWDWPDGRLEPSLAVRGSIIREFRAFRPDLVLTHRPNDYHPDHRAVGQAVCDASYLVTVPAIEPDAPALPQPPVIGYLPDRFTKPTPLTADVIVDVTRRIDTIVAMLACHRSQFFEWLPYNMGVAELVPADEADRFAWLRAWYTEMLRKMAERYRHEITASFGADRGATLQFAEIFEISEYAAPLDTTARGRLFPFASRA